MSTARYSVLPVDVLGQLRAAGCLSGDVVQLYVGLQTSTARRTIAGLVTGLGRAGCWESVWMSPRAGRRAEDALNAAGLVLFDWDARAVYVVGAIRTDPPVTPNAVKASARQFSEMAASIVKDAVRLEMESALLRQKADPRKERDGKPQKLLIEVWREELAELEGAFDAVSHGVSDVASEGRCDGLSRAGAHSDSDPIDPVTDPTPRKRERAGAMGEASQRPHVQHAACSPNFAWCVPDAVHRKLAAKLGPKHGGDLGKAGQALQAWYPKVWATLAADHVLPDAFRFWERRFDAEFAAADTVIPGRRPEPVSTVPSAEETRRLYLDA